MNRKDGLLPWTKSCFVCGESNDRGLRLRSRLTNGRVILEYTTQKEDVGYKHIVHGGIAATLLDEVMTWAAIVASSKICVAAEMTTRLRKPLEVGVAVQAEAEVKKVTSRLILTEASIIDADQTVYITASGKYMPMPRESVELTEKDFVFHPDCLQWDDIVGK